jgi:sugar lactone lactonase YvrE
MTRTPTTAAAQVELVVDAHAQVGEGPVWDPRQQRLLWTDIIGREVHVFDPVSGRDIAVPVDQPVGAIALRSAGGYVAAVQDGFAELDLESGQLALLAPVEKGLLDNRMNDGKCDRAGRFWAGTMAVDATHERGALYRLDPDHHVTCVLGGVTISNGLAWSADDSTMYYVDTGHDRVDAFDFDIASGRISRRRTLVAFEAADGRPDGMTLDADGYLWIALAGGWCVRRYGADGTLDREVRLPVRLVTSCIFGGEDLGDLYITTGGYDVAPDDPAQPNAGGLFRHRPGVFGLPPDAYRG